MQLKKGLFLKRWKKIQRKMIQRLYPEIDKKVINDYLDKVIKENLINYECEIHNNYVHKSIKSNLLEIYDYVENTKPICGGFGVFFKNQHQIANPAAQMLNNFMISRKKFKANLKILKAGTYEYQTFDRKQLSEKISANSYYGASGNKTSNFYNLYTATSTTSTGQSLISTTELAFEAFLTNSVVFNTIDECCTFVNNIINEKRNINSNFLPDKSVEEVLNRLIGNFYKFDEKYYDFLFRYISSLSQDDLNRIYFKNNLYEFSKLQRINNILVNIFIDTKEFKNPNKIPEECEEYLKTLWKYYKEFVYYDYFAFERIQRLKNDKRRCVLTIDTDSNIINLNPWVEYCFNHIIGNLGQCDGRNKSDLIFISINTMAYVMTNMVTAILKKFCNRSNIPEDYHKYVNMKNEFYMETMILASKKKRYISTIRLREGAEIYPPKLDIKGHDFAKSTVTENTKRYFMNLIKEEFVGENINIGSILKKISVFEKSIIESLKNGEKDYLIPTSVKEIEAYKEPMQQQGFRGVTIWNLLYPDQSIELPEKVDIVKVNLDTEEQCEKLKYIDKEKYDIIMREVFENLCLSSDAKRKKIISGEKDNPTGVSVIAIPRSIEKIPEWILPFVDYETIKVNNISKFYPVLESLGVEIIKTSKRDYFSNIINI